MREASASLSPRITALAAQPTLITLVERSRIALRAFKKREAFPQELTNTYQPIIIRVYLLFRLCGAKSIYSPK